MKRLIYCHILAPLIRRNYALREAGKRPDEWYWADLLAVRWGYCSYDDPKAFRGDG